MDILATLNDNRPYPMLKERHGGEKTRRSASHNNDLAVGRICILHLNGLRNRGLRIDPADKVNHYVTAPCIDRPAEDDIIIPF